MSIIETVGLRKEYSRLRGQPIVAVDGLDLAVPGAGVYGFLGPNGSGKTTTIRCLLGLIRPTAGSVKILGEDVSDLQRVIGRIGALVETPKFFPTFSGRKNLAMLAKVAGLDQSTVEQSLDTVGLRDRSSDNFSTYSLGMKQRLAVAATLLKDPDLIVLDEPANGLDPAGIVEIRQLIRQLADDGKTIFVSSHQLGEVQQTCDVVTIIANGRLIRTGPVDELVSLGTRTLLCTIDDAANALAVLLHAGFSARLGPVPDTITIEVGPEHGASVTHHLAASGRYLRSLEPQGASLESTFLELTGSEGGDLR
ncbi:MAG: ATP-binding cassette domain-containing protein [Acidimicrobiales bacterium]